jgi:hypothetical protein
LRRTGLSALLALVLVTLGAPAAALAQSAPSSPFAPGLPESTPSVTTTTTPTVSTTSTSGNSGLTGSGIVAIAVGALIVIGGISYFIWYDSRKHARVRRAATDAGAGGRAGSKTRGKPRKLSPAERRRRKRGRAR